MKVLKKHLFLNMIKSRSKTFVKKNFSRTTSRQSFHICLTGFMKKPLLNIIPIFSGG